MTLATVLGRVIAWALFTHGCTLIVTQSSLFRPLRELVYRSRFKGSLICKLISCPMCFAWWCSFFASLGGLSILSLGGAAWIEPGTHQAARTALRLWADGCAGAGWCFFVHVIMHKLGAADL